MIKRKISLKVKKPIVVEAQEEQAPAPDVVQIIGLALNPKYVYASLNGERITVRNTNGMTRNLLGKRVPVIKSADSDHYDIYHE